MQTFNFKWHGALNRPVYLITTLGEGNMGDQNSFLYVISTLGSMSKDEYAREFSSLCLKVKDPENINVEWQRQRLAWLLQALGHIEVGERGRLHACPTSLLLLWDTPNVAAILTGARDPELVERLHHHIECYGDSYTVLHVEQSQRIAGGAGELLLPDSIIVKAKNSEQLQSLARTLNIAAQLSKPVSGEILDFSGNILEYRDVLNLSHYHDQEPVNSISREFSAELVKFVRVPHAPSQSSLVEYSFEPYAWVVWYWHEGRGGPVDRSWGRYLAAKSEGKQLLIYDPLACWLAVPTTTRLPLLLSRAATLSSGLAAIEVKSGDGSKFGLPSDTGFDVYFGIRRHIAKRIADILGQQLLIHHIGPKIDMCCL